MADTLADIYAAIPKMQCKPGCTRCCGPIPMNEEEARAFGPVPLERVGPGYVLSSCMDCPHSRGGSCAIYDRRPFICRLFGTAPDHPRLRCPEGCKPDKPLTAKQANALTQRFMTMKAA